MTYREVGGSLVFQGTVSGTDQTAISLYEPTHAVRVYLENPASPTIVANGVYTVINEVASGTVTITGAGGTEVTTVGSVITVSGEVGGVTDHGTLLGLSDDDHTQYLLADGTRAMSGDLNLGGNDITSVASLTAVTGTFTTGLTVGTSTTHLNGAGIIAPSGIFSTSLTVSGLPVATSSDVTSLQNQIDAIIVDEVEPALVGTNGITVSSGSHTTTVTGFYSEFTAASGTLQSQLNNLDSVYATDAQLTSVSGHLQSEIDSIVIPDLSDALVGSDGITIISGSNTTTVSGFRGEFVAASGSLQGQIAALDSIYATDAHLVSVSGHLQSVIDAVESSDVDSITASGTALAGDITLAGLGSVSLSVSGQTVTISGAASAGAQGEQGIPGPVDAILGAGGLTVISGSNSITVSGVGDLTKEPTGFPTLTTSTISLNDTTGIVSISGTYDYYIRGQKFSKSGADSVVVSGTTGKQIIFFDGSTLTASQAPEDSAVLSSNYASVALVYWNPTTQSGTLFGEERHGIVMDWATHSYLHQTQGARYVSGFGASGYTTAGNGDLDSHAQITLAGGLFADEDLIHEISNGTSDTYWEQNLDPIAYIPVMYRVGDAPGTWRKDGATAFPLKFGSARPTYNLLTGSTWSTPDVATGDFFAMFICVTNDPREPVISVMGQDTTGALQAARDNLVWENMDFGAFPTPEIKVLYRLIFQTANSYANSIKARLRDIADYRQVIFSPVGSVASNDHGGLTGLADDDHPQYLTEARGDTRYLHQALLGLDGVAVVSGSNTVTISGFRSEFVAASGSLQSQISNLDSVYATDVVLVSVSGHLQNQISGIVADEVEPAVVGADGITVISGSSTTTVSGFYSEFTAASGSLQSQISSMDHGALSGLNDDDHPQYGHLSQNETVSGTWNFAQGATVSGSSILTSASTLGGLQKAYNDGRTINTSSSATPVHIAGAFASPCLVVVDSMAVSGTGLTTFQMRGAGIVPCFLQWIVSDVTRWQLGELFGNWVLADGAFSLIAMQVDGTTRIPQFPLGQSSAAGSATAPSIAFTADTNTGMYSAAADVIGLTAGGAQRVTISGANATTSGLGVAGHITATRNVTAASGTFSTGLTVGSSTTYIYPNEIRSPRGTFDNLTISGVSVPLGGGVTDHGALTGLGDDDHTQYLLVDGTRVMSGDLNLDENSVTRVQGITFQDQGRYDSGTGISLFTDETSGWITLSVSGVTLATYTSDGTLGYIDHYAPASYSSALETALAALTVTSEGVNTEPAIRIYNFGSGPVLYATDAETGDVFSVTKSGTVVAVSGAFTTGVTTPLITMGSPADSTWVISSGVKTAGGFTSNTIDIDHTGPGERIAKAFSFGVQNTGSNRDVTFDINTGETGDPQPGEIRFLDMGTVIWRLGKSSSNDFELRHPVHTAFPKVTIASGVPDRFLTIDADGHLGINQQTPTERLHVVGSGTFTGLITSDPESGDANGGVVARGRGTGIPFFRLANQGQAQQWRTDVSSNAWRVVDEVTGTAPVVVESGTPTNLLYLDSSVNGRVGIGTSTPSTDFQVVGSGQMAALGLGIGPPITNGVLHIQHSLDTPIICNRFGGGDNFIDFQVGGFTGQRFGMDTSGNFQIKGLLAASTWFHAATTAPANTIVVSTSDSSLVGIGATPTSGTLHVHGTGYFNSGLTVSGLPVYADRDLNRFTSVLEVANSAAETTIYSTTVPAGWLQNGRMLECKIFGDYLNSSGANRTLTLRVKYGGVTIYRDVTGNIATSATAARAWRMEFNLAGMSTPANYQYLNGSFTISNAAVTTAGVGDLGTTATFTTAVVASGTADMGAAQTFEVTLANSATLPSIRFRRHYATARMIP